MGYLSEIEHRADDVTYWTTARVGRLAAGVNRNRYLFRQISRTALDID
jgi:hypothetical protein